MFVWCIFYLNITIHNHLPFSLDFLSNANQRKIKAFKNTQSNINSNTHKLYVNEFEWKSREKHTIAYIYIERRWAYDLIPSDNLWLRTANALTFLFCCQSIRLTWKWITMYGFYIDLNSISDNTEITLEYKSNL